MKYCSHTHHPNIIRLTIGALCPSTEAALTMGPSVMVIFILLSGQVSKKEGRCVYMNEYIRVCALSDVDGTRESHRP